MPILDNPQLKDPGKRVSQKELANEAERLRYQAGVDVIRKGEAKYAKDHPGVELDEVGTARLGLKSLGVKLPKGVSDKGALDWYEKALYQLKDSRYGFDDWSGEQTFPGTITTVGGIKDFHIPAAESFATFKRQTADLKSQSQALSMLGTHPGSTLLTGPGGLRGSQRATLLTSSKGLEENNLLGKRVNL